MRRVGERNPKAYPEWMEYDRKGKKKNTNNHIQRGRQKMIYWKSLRLYYHFSVQGFVCLYFPPASFSSIADNARYNVT